MAFLRKNTRSEFSHHFLIPLSSQHGGDHFIYPFSLECLSSHLNIDERAITEFISPGYQKYTLQPTAHDISTSSVVGSHHPSTKEFSSMESVQLSQH
jgi:hypothetical protein